MLLCADFRPYFTIHDPDFQTMASAGMTPNSSNLPRLLGVTNKYFLKVCIAHTAFCLLLVNLCGAFAASLYMLSTKGLLQYPGLSRTHLSLQAGLVCRVVCGKSGAALTDFIAMQTSMTRKGQQSMLLLHTRSTGTLCHRSN